MRRKAWWAVGGGLAIVLILTGAVAYFYRPVQLPKPEKIYDYYIIIDEADGKELMYIPLVVSVNDELITEDNKRYKIVRVEGNIAYARFMEKADIGSGTPP